MQNEWYVNNLIRDAYLKKKEGNHRFSIRAFARQLGINDSSLAQIMNCRRPVGRMLASQLEKRLGIPLAAHVNRKPKISPIVAKDFGLEASTEFPWYFLALLNFLRIDSRLKNINSLVEQLNTTKAAIEEAVSGFIKQGWVIKTDRGYTVQLKRGNFNVNPAITSERAKEFQKFVLMYAQDALMDQDFSERIHNTHYFNFNSKDIPALRALTQNYFKKVTSLSVKQHDNADSTYCIQLSAFALIKDKKNAHK